jgi:hypothetical protein
LLQWKSNNYYILWVCVCSLRYPARNTHALWCHLWLATLYFSTLSHKRHDIRKTLWSINRVLAFRYRVCPKHFSLWYELSEIWSKMHIGLHVKYPLFLSDFNDPWIFSTHLKKLFKHQISCKSIYWEPSCSTRTDGRAGGKTWRSQR